ncbi:MAG TPA: hypothetical protein VLG46_04685 [Anaerolineae bacterium]|nr:hypothetical protein [Anaerolineae bacterium]
MTETQLLPVVWTLASMTVAVLAILFVSSAQLERLRMTTGGRLLEQFLRVVYFLGVPYAALLTGSLASIDMGVTGAGGSILGWSPAEWLRGLSTGLTLAVIVLIPIGAEIHWVFYRAAPLILLGDVYAAVLFGVLLVGVEWIVVLIRNGLSGSPGERQIWLRRGVLLALSSAIFVLTRNVWLALFWHIVLELAWKVWLRRLVPRPIALERTPLVSVSDPDVRPLHERS